MGAARKSGLILINLFLTIATVCYVLTQSQYSFIQDEYDNFLCPRLTVSELRLDDFKVTPAKKNKWQTDGHLRTVFLRTVLSEHRHFSESAFNFNSAIPDCQVC